MATVLEQDLTTRASRAIATVPSGRSSQHAGPGVAVPRTAGHHPHRQRDRPGPDRRARGHGVRPNARSLAVSQGKGLTLAAAKASGVMEAIELYHAERIAPLKLGNATASTQPPILIDLRPAAAGQPLPPPPAVALDRGPRSRHRAPIWVPMRWSRQLHPAAADRQRLLPANSNGLASGNHLLEAISHGSARSSSATHRPLWNLGPVALGEPASIWGLVDDPGCPRYSSGSSAPGSRRGLGHHHRRRHRRVLMPDHGAYGDPLRLLRPAAHPAVRAVTEAIQVAPPTSPGSRDDLRRFTAPALEQKLRRARPRWRGSSSRANFPTCRAMRPQPAPTT